MQPAYTVDLATSPAWAGQLIRPIHALHFAIAAVEGWEVATGAVIAGKPSIRTGAFGIRSAGRKWCGQRQDSWKDKVINSIAGMESQS